MFVVVQVTNVELKAPSEKRKPGRHKVKDYHDCFGIDYDPNDSSTYQPAVDKIMKKCGVLRSGDFLLNKDKSKKKLQLADIPPQTDLDIAKFASTRGIPFMLGFSGSDHDPVARYNPEWKGCSTGGVDVNQLAIIHILIKSVNKKRQIRYPYTAVTLKKLQLLSFSLLNFFCCIHVLAL